jgi:peptidoglycan/xylan/chitin deacetylase (PgdA/CDA1 family)
LRAILTYHSLDHSGSVISLHPETFERHLAALDARGIAVVSLERLLHMPDTVEAVALTFDDAFENFRTKAWPLIRERGLPVTLFVPTDHVGGSNAWEGAGSQLPRLPLLDWAALGSLASEGVTIGAHSASHARMSAQDSASLAREVDEPADRILAETGQVATVFAYPYGDQNERVRAAVRTRYPLACTTELRALGGAEDRQALPRLDMWYFRKPESLDAWGRSSFRAYLTLRNRLRAVRRWIFGGGGR